MATMFSLHSSSKTVISNSFPCSARVIVPLLSVRFLLNLIFVKMSKGNISANLPFDQRLAMAKRCSHEGVIAGAKAAVVATIATAIPTLASVRMLPWARANLNHTAQALIISTVAGAAYFIVADKTVLATARKNSFNPPSNVEA